MASRWLRASAWIGGGLLLSSLIFGCNPGGEPTVRNCHPPGACDTLLKRPIQEKKVTVFSSKGGDATAGRTTWRELCAICHGETGKGGMSMGGPVADLTTPRWQSATSDSQIADAILHGKGRMPSFTLDESALKDLVRHVRTLTEKPKGY